MGRLDPPFGAQWGDDDPSTARTRRYDDALAVEAWESERPTREEAKGER